jgi:UDP-3-O-[3-hydroxymyristoyl] N-acetylglucosamine deacetylase
MRADRLQTTLAAPCTVSGRGYWLGQPNVLTFLPAPANTGIRFVRTDLEGRPGVAAVAERRCSMPLRTRLSQARAEVDMVEHVMAALYGMQIDNAIVQCTSSEMPAMDGSSMTFALALHSAGRVELSEPRATLVIDRNLRVGNDEQWIVARPVSRGSSPRLSLQYQLDYGSDSPIGRATCALTLEPQKFFDDIAPARTFISQETAVLLQTRGLATHVTERDLLVFDAHGPVGNQLRFSDECARHKMLDLIGDLALTGFDMVGEIVAYRSGHQLNGEMAEKLRELAGCAGDQCSKSLNQVA